MSDKMYLQFLFSSSHVTMTQPCSLLLNVFYQLDRVWVSVQEGLKASLKIWHSTFFAKYFRFIKKLKISKLETFFSFFLSSSMGSFHLLPPPLCSSTPLISPLLFLSPSVQECVNIYLCLCQHENSSTPLSNHFLPLHEQKTLRNQRILFSLKIFSA